MHMFYNGVTLDILTLDRVERTTIFTPDQTTVLYTEWNIAATCTLARNGGTAFTFQQTTYRNRAMGQDSGSVTGGQGLGVFDAFGLLPTAQVITNEGVERPIPTDREARVLLSVPRKQLYIGAYNAATPQTFDYWLRSPRPGLVSDAKHGPVVRALPINGTIGEATAVNMSVEITTWEPPCPEGFDRLVLAHRWQMTVDRDEDYYPIRTTVGEVHFHAGMLRTFGNRASWFQRQFFHPIPLGHQRKIGPIALSPDGLVLRYQFTDTEQRLVFSPGKSGGTHIEIQETMTHLASGRVPRVDARPPGMGLPDRGAVGDGGPVLRGGRFPN